MGETKIDLTPDEVLMIGGVLELRGKLFEWKMFYWFKDKFPKNIMTPLDKVFMISYYAELDQILWKMVQFAVMMTIDSIYRSKAEDIVEFLYLKTIAQI